ncbi:hypothetical protein GKE82_25220 [Conexibacter sp. W3-3-2]|uniref:hypothetical protein n=1 Tax=Conexibacter sp. W3-3-2 TaxID=2675227 RepID=UPI0012B8E69B|nr:hypothetical protein [Conexibacter sp. W3-3-2]MTD47508.1 hypothetical protein [Conexibacter sp. W3-3-2]
MTGRLEIERAWEVDRSRETPGEPWVAYGWLLGAAHRLGHDEISILVSGFRVFEHLGPALGMVEARALFEPPHRYAFGGVVVQGVSWRGGLSARGPVLMVGGDTDRLTAIEDAGVPAVAAVTADPAALELWCRVHRPLPLGSTRPVLEVARDPLPAVVIAAIRAATDTVNGSDMTLGPVLARRLAGALIALRARDLRVHPEDLATFLMTLGWEGRLVLDGVAIGRRVWNGETPRHDPWRLGRDSAVG